MKITSLLTWLLGAVLLLSCSNKDDKKLPEGVGINTSYLDTTVRPSEEKAVRLQAVMDYRLLNLSKGKVDESPSYESVKDHKYSGEELRYVQYNRQRMIIGTPDVVKEKFTALAEDFEVDEIVVATFADTKEDRLRSYELLAGLFNISSSRLTAAYEDRQGS